MEGNALLFVIALLLNSALKCIENLLDFENLEDFFN